VQLHQEEDTIVHSLAQRVHKSRYGANGPTRGRVEYRERVSLRGRASVVVVNPLSRAGISRKEQTPDYPASVIYISA